MKEALKVKSRKLSRPRARRHGEQVSRQRVLARETFILSPAREYIVTDQLKNHIAAARWHEFDLSGEWRVTVELLRRAKKEEK